MEVDSHLLREQRKRWCGFSFPTEIPPISVGWPSRGLQGHVGSGIPSYQDISDYEKEVQGKRNWKVEGGGRGTSKGRNTLGWYLEIRGGPKFINFSDELAAKQIPCLNIIANQTQNVEAQSRAPILYKGFSEKIKEKYSFWDFQFLILKQISLNQIVWWHY